MSLERIARKLTAEAARMGITLDAPAAARLVAVVLDSLESPDAETIAEGGLAIDPDSMSRDDCAEEAWCAMLRHIRT